MSENQKNDSKKSFLKRNLFLIVIFLVIDKPFAKEDPTINPPINPGPNVAAIAEIFEKLIFLIDLTNVSKISKCCLAAISGITPP